MASRPRVGAMRAEGSRWRAHALQVVRETLAALPPTATLKEKLAALHDAYPFGERRYLPHRHWCRVVRETLDYDRATAPLTVPRLKFKADPPVPTGYEPFLAAMIADPADAARRLIFSDFLEEQGDTRASAVRNPEVTDRAVLVRLRWHQRGNHAKLTALIRDQRAGAVLLVDPDVPWAVAVESTVAALQLFGTVREMRRH